MHGLVPHRPRAARCSDELVGADLDVVEVHLELRVRRDRHLLRHREAGALGVDEEVRGAVGGAGEHEEVIGGGREVHVPFRAGEAPAVAVGLGAELYALGPEPSARFQPGDRHDHLTRRDRRQPFVALRVGARPQDDTGAHHRAHEVRRRRQRPPQLGVDDHRVEHGHPAPAVVLGQRHPEQTELGELLPELVRVTDGIVLHGPHHVEARVARTHTGNRFSEHLLLGGEVEIHRTSSQFRAATARRGGPRGCRPE